MPNPAVFRLSITALPEKASNRAMLLRRILSGCCCQCSRSVLVACPQVILPQDPANRIVLEEEMVGAVEVDQAVRVVVPTHLLRKA